MVCYFDENPKGNCRFGSINGDVKLYFQSPLSAEFAIKTFNGSVFSDFELTPITSDPEIIRKNVDRTVYKLIRRFCAKSGHNGPRIILDGFNGDLYILNNNKGDQS